MSAGRPGNPAFAEAPPEMTFKPCPDLEAQFRELDQRFFAGRVERAGWRVVSADTSKGGPLHGLAHAGDLDLMGCTIYELEGRRCRVIGIDQDIVDRAYRDSSEAWVYASILWRTLLHEMAHAVTEEGRPTDDGDPHVRRRFQLELRRLGRLGERWASLEAKYYRSIPPEKRATVDLPEWLEAKGYAREYYGGSAEHVRAIHPATRS